MISKKLKDEWADKANKLYQRENDISEVLHKGTLTKVLRQVSGEFSKLDDEAFLKLENEQAVYNFLEGLCTDERVTTTRVVQYLRRAF